MYLKQGAALFVLRSQKSEVKRMIASPNEAAICDVCIEICNAILEDQNIEENTENIVLPTPSEIKEQLDNT